MVSPHNQFNNMNMSGNVSNVPSLPLQSFGNVGPSSGISDLVGSKRRLVTMPQQKSQLQPPNMSIRSPVKTYEPGMCARRLTHYMYQQQQRPQDNNIQFWRKFVSEFFAPNAKKRWCVSMYANGRQTSGVFPQDVWHCEICNRRPGRGYEATAEVLPRLFRIKFESGTIEELLYVDMPKEYQNSSGQIVLDYAKATQQCIFEQFHVVREGQLRIVFSPDLKICSWEFCARRHEELIPKRLLIPQVSQLGSAAQKYQEAAQNASSEISSSELQNNSNMFVGSVRQLAKALEVPLVNDVGYTKRYVRCLQISEVVNSMKDLMEYSRESNTGPMESLAKYPRLDPSRVFRNEPQQPEGPLQQQQQIIAQNSNNDVFLQSAAMQLAPTNGGMTSVSNTLNSVPATPSAPTTIGIVRQNSMNSRQQNAMSTPNSPYGGNNVQMPSPGPSDTNTMPPPQRSPPLQSPALPSSNNLLQQMQQAAFSGDTYANEPQSSVQKVIQEMMMSSSQLGGGNMMNMGTMSNNVKNVNGLSSSHNTGLGRSNNIVSNLGVGGDGFRQPGMVNMANRMRLPVGNNQPQQELANQLLGGLGAGNGLNDLQFNWKPS